MRVVFSETVVTDAGIAEDTTIDRIERVEKVCGVAHVCVLAETLRWSWLLERLGSERSMMVVVGLVMRLMVGIGIWRIVIVGHGAAIDRHIQVSRV